MLKIKDWAKPETKFGFVLNSSNFYNEKSNKFIKFFFEFYQIEEFYELSRVKKLLFRQSKESVVVVIFNNKKIKSNLVNYYPVDMGIFSEIFDLLIIQEDKKIEIPQSNILNNKVILRDYLIGNKHDLKLLDNFSDSNKLKTFFLKDENYNSFRGLERVDDATIREYFKMSKNDFKNLSRKEKSSLHKQFAEHHYLSSG